MKIAKALLLALSFYVLTACNGGHNEEKGVFIEIAAFSLADGTTESAFLESFDAVQHRFMNTQKGLIKRELAKKSATEFVEILHWKTRLDADQAYAEFYKSPVCLAYVKLLRPSKDTTSGVQRLEVLRTF